jgi:heptosyltransferase-2
VLLGPGAIYGPAKRWAAERFAAVGRDAARDGARVLVCGTKAEVDTCAEVAGAIGSAAVSFAGQTDLAALAALCAGARFALCNDSGLAHLAAATGAPTVVIFGSTSSAWTAPLGARVRVVQRPPVCSPCFRRTCRIGYACLDRVAVDDVLRASRAAVGS